MRRTGAVLVILDGLLFIVGMMSISGKPDWAANVLICIGLVLIVCGFMGFKNNDSRLWGGIALTITILMMLFTGMMVLQLILGLAGGILLLMKKE